MMSKKTDPIFAGNSSSCLHRPLALVTGAAGIIGPAITKNLRSAGWRVIATDKSQDYFDLYKKAFGTPVDADEIITANLDTHEACVSLISKIEARHGGISAIINGAVINAGLPFSAITEADAIRHFSINVFAAIFLAQAARPSLAKNHGAIVNFSSMLVEEPKKGGLLYACSKAALEKATEAMAWELREDGVRVNCIRVGIVPGYHFLRKTIKDMPDDLARNLVRDLVAERIEEIERQHGVQSIGRPEDIAQAVAFLLSPSARFINGRSLIMDGGPHSLNVQNGSAPQTFSVEQRVSRWLEQNLTSVAQ